MPQSFTFYNRKSDGKCAIYFSKSNSGQGSWQHWNSSSIPTSPMYWNKKHENFLSEITLSQNNHSLSHCSTSNKLDRSFGVGPGTTFFRILRIYRLCAVSLAVNSANTSYYNWVWILFRNGKNKKEPESFLKSLLYVTKKGEVKNYLR